MKFPFVYLASRSPRRRELLEQIGVEFEVISPDIDESLLPGEKAKDYVLRLARDKAKAGNRLLVQPHMPVLAADTIVVVDEQILGKPVSQQQAKQMLKMLSGRKHEVMTAIALSYQDEIQTLLSVNKVSFTTMTDGQLDWYVNTGEGSDKAGSYAVQGLAALFIEKIEGSYSGIMGLPIRETGQLLSMGNYCE